MKRYIYILPVALALSCAQSKFKGETTANAPLPVTAEKSDDGTDQPKPGESTPKGGDSKGGGGDTIPSKTGDVPKKDGDSPKKDGKIPKVPDDVYSVQKFGANFEDFKDGDFNDAVLCFKGSFELNTKTNTIVALKDQDVTPVTFSGGDCHHDVTVEIVSASGTSTFKESFPSRPYSADDKNPPANAKDTPSLLKFKKGDKLEIKMKVVDGVCDSKIERSMHNKAYTRLLPDVCYGDY